MTIETLTDEMIQALWREAGATSAARAFGAGLERVPRPVVDARTCEMAAGEWHSYSGHACSLQDHRWARQRTCDVLNARGSIA